MARLRVLSVASEAYPLIKTGGLADVVGALPLALAREDIAVRTLLPGYPQVLAGLQREVGAIALDLAGKIVGEVLTDDARARAAVDRFIADLERAASEAGR